MCPKLTSIPTTTLSEHDYLLGLVALAQWQKASKDGSPNAEFFTDIHKLQATLEADSRLVVLQNIADGRCYGCGTRIANIVNQGDHVIPLSAGGPRGMDNFSLMCRWCNASKGSYDLVSWWLKQGRSLLTLDPNVLTIYARTRFKMKRMEGPTSLEFPAPWWAQQALDQVSNALPSGSHRRAFSWIRANLLPPALEANYIDRQ